jgi:hypothetical protein
MIPVAQPAMINAEDAQWLENHASQIAAYNAWAEMRPTFSESVREWREAQQVRQASAASSAHLSLLNQNSQNS